MASNRWRPFCSGQRSRRVIILELQHLGSCQADTHYLVKLLCCGARRTMTHQQIRKRTGVNKCNQCRVQGRPKLTPNPPAGAYKEADFESYIIGKDYGITPPQWPVPPSIQIGQHTIWADRMGKHTLSEYREMSNNPEDFIPFQEGLALKRCTPTWLSWQIQTGNVATKIVMNKSSVPRYLVSKTDLEKLVYTRIEPRVQSNKQSEAEVKSETPIPMCGTLIYELKQEARDVNMPLEEYLSLVGR